MTDPTGPNSESSTPKTGCLTPWFIIALLVFAAVFAAILVPVIMSNISDAKSRACEGHMRELSQAIIEYSQDYDDRMPPADRWTDCIIGRLTGTPAEKEMLLRCPSSSCTYAYAMNRAAGEQTMDVLLGQSSTVLLFESDANRPNASGGEADIAWKRHIIGRNEFANFVLCGGESRFFTKPELTTGQSGRTVIWDYAEDYASFVKLLRAKRLRPVLSVGPFVSASPDGISVVVRDGTESPKAAAILARALYVDFVEWRRGMNDVAPASCTIVVSDCSGHLLARYGRQ